ncbi:MAG: urea ABC transporter permease subunit UrtC, partial [Mesorhizobium sp.]
VTLLLPKGIVGMWDSWRSKARALRTASLAADVGSDPQEPQPKIVRSAARTPGAWSAAKPEPQPAE